MGILDKLAAVLGSGPKTFHILVIGLDNSGKSTVINFLKPENVRVAGDIPPTIGVQIEKVRFKNVILQIHDMSGQSKYRAMWERCYSDCHAIVFVLDISDQMRIAVAKDEFEGAIQHSTLQQRRVPFLILANKKDQPNSVAANRVLQLMDLEKVMVNRPWHLELSNAVNGEGITEGFTWLTDLLASLVADPKNTE